METTYTLRITAPASPGVLEFPRSFSGLTFSAAVEKLRSLAADYGAFTAVRIECEREVSSR